MERKGKARTSSRKASGLEADTPRKTASQLHAVVLMRYSSLLELDLGSGAKPAAPGPTPARSRGELAAPAPAAANAGGCSCWPVPVPVPVPVPFPVPVLGGGLPSFSFSGLFRGCTGPRGGYAYLVFGFGKLREQFPITAFEQLKRSSIPIKKRFQV